MRRNIFFSYVATGKAPTLIHATLRKFKRKKKDVEVEAGIVEKRKGTRDNREKVTED